MKKALLYLLLSVMILTAGSPGIRPRADAGSYPASTKDVDLYPNDFTLSVGEKSTALRPVSADTIAEVLAGKQEPPRVSGPHDINTSAGVSIGCASYPDPVSAMLVHVAAGLAAGLVLSILFDSIAAKWVDPMEALRYE